jgi:protein-S-isoprenylcysteine O-methyltransferase Ste14
MALLKWPRYHCAFAIMLFAFMLDIFVPPTSLRPVVSQDRMVDDRISVLAWIWSRPLPQQVVLAFVCTLPSWAIVVAMGSWMHGAGANDGGGGRGGGTAAAGVVVATCGFLLRQWSKAVLASDFTYRISAPVNGLVTTGPYAFLVHPGYTGSLVHLVGLCVLAAPAGRRAGIALVVVATAAVAAALKLRVDDEEALLAATFGAQWTNHVAARWHLVPLVW